MGGLCGGQQRQGWADGGGAACAVCGARYWGSRPAESAHPQPCCSPTRLLSTLQLATSCPLRAAAPQTRVESAPPHHPPAAHPPASSRPCDRPPQDHYAKPIKLGMSKSAEVLWAAKVRGRGGGVVVIRQGWEQSRCAQRAARRGAACCCQPSMWAAQPMHHLHPTPPAGPAAQGGAQRAAQGALHAAPRQERGPGAAAAADWVARARAVGPLPMAAAEVCAGAALLFLILPFPLAPAYRAPCPLPRVPMSSQPGVAEQLPTKTDNIVFCELRPAQKRAYGRVIASPDVQLLKRAPEDCDCGSREHRSACCHKCARTASVGLPGRVFAGRKGLCLLLRLVWGSTSNQAVAWRIPPGRTCTEEEGGIMWPYYHLCECGEPPLPRPRHLGCPPGRSHWPSQHALCGAGGPRTHCHRWLRALRRHPLSSSPPTTMDGRFHQPNDVKALDTFKCRRAATRAAGALGRGWTAPIKPQVTPASDTRHTQTARRRRSRTAATATARTAAWITARGAAASAPATAPGESG